MRNNIALRGLKQLSVVGLGAVLLGCGTTSQTGTPPGGSPPQHIEMEPLKIEATREGNQIRLDAYDATELFEQAGRALGEKKYDEAAALYTKLLQSFPTSSYVRPSYYNRGLAFIGKKDWNAAVDSFRALIAGFASHEDAKDGLFQLGACYAEMANWPASVEVFTRLLERKDLTADDRIEAMARRGFAHFNLNDLETAERSFHAVLTFRKSIENEERLGTDFYLAFSHYHLGQIQHQRFRAVTLRLPESQMDKDLDEKAQKLLLAQRAYIDTIRLGNPAWASAAGFQVGSLYEELYDAFMHAPMPPEMTDETRTVYRDELQKKIKILLEKSLRWQRENLLMVERLGVNTDWAEKSRLAYAKVLKLLDPRDAAWEFRDGPPPAPPQAPQVPDFPMQPQVQPPMKKNEQPESIPRRIM